MIQENEIDTYRANDKNKARQKYYHQTHSTQSMYVLSSCSIVDTESTTVYGEGMIQENEIDTYRANDKNKARQKYYHQTHSTQSMYVLSSCSTVDAESTTVYGEGMIQENEIDTYRANDKNKARQKYYHQTHSTQSMYVLSSCSTVDTESTTCIWRRNDTRE